MEGQIHLSVESGWGRSSLCGERLSDGTITTLDQCHHGIYEKICSECFERLHRQALKTTGVVWLDRKVDVAYRQTGR